jgi:peptidoglycan/xylan/chitin deacetylase (PgdA/CDA1 family)
VTRDFRPLVLCYHAVSDDWEHVLAVRPSALERQIRRVLRQGYQPATATETLARGGQLLHVTFDDAYRSIGQALSLLEQLRVPCTVFACSDYTQDGRPLAVPELGDEAESYPGELATMTWDQLREFLGRGVEIGSHTSTHPHLTRLSDRELEVELTDSRARIEDELNCRCRFLAYPYGECDARVMAAARSAGYEAAFAERPDEKRFDPFAVPRVGIYRRDHALRSRLKTSALIRRVLV